eukprot:11171989-Lingulodinium_polyedra.AAC.1
MGLRWLEVDALPTAFSLCPSPPSPPPAHVPWVALWPGIAGLRGCWRGGGCWWRLALLRARSGL